MYLVYGYFPGKNLEFSYSTFLKAPTKEIEIPERLSDFISSSVPSTNIYWAPSMCQVLWLSLEMCMWIRQCSCPEGVYNLQGKSYIWHHYNTSVWRDRGHSWLKWDSVYQAGPIFSPWASSSHANCGQHCFSLGKAFILMGWYLTLPVIK